mgnify:CR=1 FL=1
MVLFYSAVILRSRISRAHLAVSAATTCANCCGVPPVLPTHSCTSATSACASETVNRGATPQALRQWPLRRAQDSRSTSSGQPAYFEAAAEAAIDENAYAEQPEEGSDDLVDVEDDGHVACTAVSLAGVHRLDLGQIGIARVVRDGATRRVPEYGYQPFCPKDRRLLETDLGQMPAQFVHLAAEIGKLNISQRATMRSMQAPREPCQFGRNAIWSQVSSWVRPRRCSRRCWARRSSTDASKTRSRTSTRWRASAAWRV